MIDSIEAVVKDFDTSNFGFAHRTEGDVSIVTLNDNTPLVTAAQTLPTLRITAVGGKPAPADPTGGVMPAESCSSRPSRSRSSTAM